LNDLRKEMVEQLPRLRRFALALTGNIDDADDLVQTALEKALMKLSTFTPGTRMDSWMIKIAQNHWIDAKRSDQRKGVRADVDEIIDIVGEDGRKTMERRAQTAEVIAAIAELPEAQRLVVARVLVDGQSYAEAAENLDIPIGTLMSRLSRARRALETRILAEPALP
jgi:RNA polymerase sigma-70 factor (ECF subfamily)